MAAVAIVLSYLLVQVDTWIDAAALRKFGWVYASGPEGARAILSAIASSMITVAGLTFSITMLTLQLASSQFGPRLLRNFMRDRGNQLVLGTFIATFVYCLLVLRTVRGTEDSHFVPHVAVAFGLLLALGSIAVLIFFIHHIATSIRIETLLEQLGAETRSAIDLLYPDRIGLDPPAAAMEPERQIPSDFGSRVRIIRSGHGGYVQRVDVDALTKQATERALIIKIVARPGSFLKCGDPLLACYPPERATDDAADWLRKVIVIGQERSPEQDLEFSIRRIVEIAQRALSPGINDPTTALYCIDRLGETLARLAERDVPSALRFDEKGQLRVIAEAYSLDELACPAFAAIARYGMADADVIAHLLGTMEMLVGVASAEMGEAIAEQRNRILRESDRCGL